MRKEVRDEAALELRGLAGAQLAAADALGDAVLLILAALADFVVAVVGRVGVVLVLIDLVLSLIHISEPTRP